MNRRSSRKLLVWITALCLIFSLVGLVSAASANDVKGHWAEAIVNIWTSQGLVSGYEDGTVRPNSKVERQV